jgi:hypothetical protein
VEFNIIIPAKTEPTSGTAHNSVFSFDKEIESSRPKQKNLHTNAGFIEAGLPGALLLRKKDFYRIRPSHN